MALKAPGSSRKKNPEGRMALGEHLRELRKRFLLSLIGIVIGLIVGWIFYDEIFALLRAPFDALNELDGGDKVAMLNFGSVAAGIDAKIRVAFFVAVLVSSPWWIYQIWAFIAPGLTSREKRYTAGFLLPSVALFLGGAYMAWVTLPRAVMIMVSFTPAGTWQVQDALTYLKFVIQFILAFGLAFLMPMVMAVLTWIGVVPGKTWIKGWRWAVIGVATFCAAVTPTTDVMTMVTMAVPMLALYFLACGFCLLRDRFVRRRRAREDAEHDDEAQVPDADASA